MKYFRSFGYVEDEAETAGCPVVMGMNLSAWQHWRREKQARGLEQLAAALAWLGAPSGPADGVLVLSSPTIHHARSFISEKAHEMAVEKIIALVNDASPNFGGVVVWMGATPYAGNSAPYPDNRNYRRARLAHIEELTFAKHGFKPLRMNVWDMCVSFFCCFWEFRRTRRLKCMLTLQALCFE